MTNQLAYSFLGDGTDYVNVFFDSDTGGSFSVQAYDSLGNPISAKSSYTTMSPNYEGVTAGLICGTNNDPDLGNIGVQYDIYGKFTTPFALIHSATPNSPSCAVTPPQCDLTLSVESTNETEQGGDNGTAILTATSSFDNIEVSINGIDWFSSPHAFIGLNPDEYTAQARDSNGCSRSVLFTIEAFANPITKRPEVLVSLGNISRWNAAFNPVAFTFQEDPNPSRTNYRIEIEITSQSGIVTGSWSPNKTGFVRADISAYLQSLVNARDNFKYDVINWRDIDRAASFTVRYRGVWDEDSTVWFDAPQPYYVTWSAMQLGDKYGGNMAQYVPFLNEPNPDYKAKWLTLFKEPTFNVGYPFDLSFIFSEYIIGSEVKMRTTSLDINRNPIAGGVVYGYLLNNDAGYILNTDTSRLIIQEGALPPVANDGILDQLGINRLMMAGTPANNVEYYQVQLYTGDDITPNFITQPIIIKVNKPCNDPYIYLKWLNTLGGWDYFRFGFDQVLSVNTSDGITIDRNVFDWENDETISDTITKNSINRISFGATVCETKIEGLRGIHNSTHIMLQVGFNPIKFHTVTLGVGGFEIKRTRSHQAEFRLQISLPQINIQRQ